MDNSANGPGPDLNALQQDLGKLESLLTAEFDALKTQNLNRLENLLAEKEAMIGALGEQSLDSVLADLASQPDKGVELEMRWQQLTGLARRCRDLQKRNEILVERKLSVVRSALSSLVAPEAGLAIETYNRQGKLSSANRGPGSVR
jgi:flagellar biosynthesis/type III secretory pathway chaperone